MNVVKEAAAGQLDLAETEVDWHSLRDVQEPDGDDKYDGDYHHHIDKVSEMYKNLKCNNVQPIAKITRHQKLTVSRFKTYLPSENTYICVCIAHTGVA